MANSGRQDLYAVLGVSRDVNADDLKKAYRRKAQQYHPDRNPDDAEAEERFKQVSAAYDVLSEPSRRRDYDEFGDIVLDKNFDADAARARANFGGGHPFDGTAGFGGAGLEDILGQFFGGAASGPRARRGADLETDLHLEFRDAALGTERKITVDKVGADGDPKRETLTIKIPPGVSDGARIRLAGKGSQGLGGGPAGDLFATIHVRPHPVFKRDGQDLILETSIGVAEAIAGADIDIPTLTGKLTLHVPAGTDGGSRLRLKGKGIPETKGKAAGDLYVSLRVRVPKNLDEATLARYAELAEHDPKDLRADFDPYL